MMIRRHAPLVLFAALCLAVLAGCGPDARPKWSAYGSDVLGCAAPGVAATVEAGIADLTALAAGSERADWRAVGTGLAARYGVPLAICAVEAAFKRFSGPVALPAAAPPVAQAAAWLVAHKGEWVP